MKHLLIIIFSIGIISPLLAQSPLNLSNAIQTGLDNNYQIQIAEKRIDISKNNNTMAAAGALPRITGAINSNNTFAVINNPTSFLDSSTLGGLGITPSIDLTWVLFDNYKVKINKQRFEELEEQSKGNSDLVIENTIHAIVLAYYRAVIEQQKINVFTEVMELSRDRYDYELENRELGTGSTFNVVQVKDAYWTDSTNLLRQQTFYQSAIRNLNLAMGEDDLNQPYTLTDSINFNPQPFAFQTLRSKMLESNRTLNNQLLNQKLLQSQSQLAMTNQWFIPRVTMSTGFNNALSQNFLWRESLPEVFSAGGNQFTYYLNFSVSFNLFDAGASKRAIQNALVEERIGELSISDQQRTLSGQLSNQLAAYQDQLKFIKLNDELIVNAAQNLGISEERYRRSLINSFDYRNVQLAYLRASLTKLENIYTLKTIEAELTRLTGGIVTD